MKRGKTHWNYRVVTKLHIGQMAHDLTNGTGKKLPDERLFSITEVYYTNGKPDSYVEPGNRGVSDYDSVKDLKWTLKKMKKAFKKPVLDLDHWPKTYIPGSDIQVTNDLYS